MSDKTRFPIREVTKPVHPLGWNCGTCFHAVKDPTPGSRGMKCCRYPPVSHPLIERGQFNGTVQISPPVSDAEWCGEYKAIGPRLDA